MAENVNLSLRLTGSGSHIGAASGSTPTEAWRLGLGDWGDLLRRFIYGTSDTPSAEGYGYINQFYVGKRTLNAATTENLDLNAASGGLTNRLAQAIQFIKIKLLLVAVASPDGTKKIRIGPQGVANAWQGPFGGVAAANYLEVPDWGILVNNKWAGHAVTPGTGDLLPVNNPGGSAVDYLILIGGVQ